MVEEVKEVGVDVVEEVKSEEVKAPKRSRTNYNDIRSELDKPRDERKETFQTRNGTFKVGRRYHLTDVDKAKILDKHEKMGCGDIINPLMLRIGPYWSAVEALIRLGADEWHNMKPIHDKMQEIMTPLPKKTKDAEGKVFMTNLWDHFMNKTPRKDAVKPRDGIGKIKQNFEVLQRLPWKMVDGVITPNGENNPYGLKLAQFLMSIDMRYVSVPGCPEQIPQICLNTGWDDEGNVVPLKAVKVKKSKKSKVEVEETSPSGEAI
jgi:hypothetical protein